MKELFLKMELANAQKDLDGTPLLNNVYNWIVRKSVIPMVLLKMD